MFPLTLVAFNINYDCKNLVSMYLAFIWMFHYKWFDVKRRFMLQLYFASQSFARFWFVESSQDVLCCPINWWLVTLPISIGLFWFFEVEKEMSHDDWSEKYVISADSVVTFRSNHCSLIQKLKLDIKKLQFWISVCIFDYTRQLSGHWLRWHL